MSNVMLAHTGVSAKVIVKLGGQKRLATTQCYFEVNDEIMGAPQATNAAPWGGGRRLRGAGL